MCGRRSRWRILANWLKEDTRTRLSCWGRTRSTTRAAGRWRCGRFCRHGAGLGGRRRPRTASAPDAADPSGGPVRGDLPGRRATARAATCFALPTRAERKHHARSLFLSPSADRLRPAPAERRQALADVRQARAQLRTIDGVDGVNFAVWAPNATSVSVVGDFNDWDGRRHPMRKHIPSGFWELFVPGLGEGTLYKYPIRHHDAGVREVRSRSASPPKCRRAPPRRSST